MIFQIISNRLKPLEKGFAMIVEVVTYMLIGDMLVVTKETRTKEFNK